MNLLWLVNVRLPEVSKIMKWESRPYGGWLINSSKKLSELPNIKLNIAYPEKKVKNLELIKGKNINYYAFKPKGNSHFYKSYFDSFQKIIELTNPDLVNIYGTELNHVLPMVDACLKNGTKFVITALGLTTAIQEHIYSNIPINVILGYTIRNIIKRDNIKRLKNNFMKRAEREKEILNKSEYFIGRTTFDRAVATQINPNINYYMCNETLREEFYKHRWDVQNIERYSIFISQGKSPYKGLHNLLKAVSIVSKKYPDTKLYVAGNMRCFSNNLVDKMLITRYEKYLEQLILKLNLKKRVIFTGTLDEKQMCERYLKSHVYVSASSIENSPNSLAEAMILGVPSVASYVGGVPNMMDHGKEGFLYQHDAPYMLSYFISKIFEDDNLAMNLSENSVKRASKVHDIDSNVEKLVKIYEEILSD